VWANDIDPRKESVYVANHGGDHFVLGDVAAVDADTLPPGAAMAWASFPCQDLSLAGWQRGMSADRSGTFWAFWRIMRHLTEAGRCPPLIVIENVVGLLYGSNLVGLCEALAALGKQFGALVIDAKAFVPQSRPRVFMVAVDEGLDPGQWVEPEPASSPWITRRLWSAYEQLPGSLRELWRWWRLPVPQPLQVSFENLMEDNPGVPWHTPEETQHLLDMMTEPTRRKLAGKRVVGTLYRRMRGGKQRAEVRTDGMAGCLRTPRGGSSRQTVIVVQGETVRSRLLSPREAARLMGVPDSFWLPEGYNDAYLAMGDAVVVPAVSWLAEHLLTPMARAATRPNALQSILRDRSSHLAEAERLAAAWEGQRG